MTNSRTYSNACDARAARRCHGGIGTGAGCGRMARHAMRSDVSRKIVMPIDLWNRYQCSLRGETGSATIDSPSSRLATTSAAVTQCRVIAPRLYCSLTLDSAGFIVVRAAKPGTPEYLTAFSDGLFRRPSHLRSAASRVLHRGDERPHAVKQHLHGDGRQHQPHQPLHRDH